ncbi:hypothetical protein HO173_004986 [Letharia columbiana]|uniref:2-hydroxyacid dehydrogenase n=1 Tax=Letharia columbiana TaxID=112416 RepID=A0A8H6L5T1_9LECA|nr:uncharacterized protein HO173_004986 [Letharia columbiana]KAF6236695.1 hypothetical protein HO173_004986 [Letharia columbiana]
MSKPKVLLLGDIEHPSAKESFESLSSIAQLVTPNSDNPSDFLKECRSGAFNGVRAAYRTFNSVKITGRIEGEVCEELGKAGLRFLAHNGAGYDQCDIPDCTKAGIHVSNVPTAVDAATADTSLFLMLGALRMFASPLINLRKGEFRGKTPPPLGHDPEGKLLGIVGMGGIGRDFKKKAEALGMNVQYHNRSKLSDEMSGGAKYVGFEELLETSDVISLNVPLNKSTHHMISTPQFSKMKDGVVMVNTARGAVIDEAALVKALSHGKVFSAGLDVYEEEPKIHQGLVDNPHVLLLPHMGTWTYETQEKMEHFVVDNVRSALEAGKLKSPVHEQKDMPLKD